MEFDINSGITYSKETMAICAGVMNRKGDICSLACGNQTPNEPVFKDQKQISTHSTISKHHQFQCNCQTDDQGKEFCYWMPLEPVWYNPRSCNSGVVVHNMDNKVRIKKLNPWAWKSLGKIDSKTKQLWDRAVRIYRHELFEDPANRASDEDLYGLAAHFRSAGGSNNDGAFDWIQSRSPFSRSINIAFATPDSVFDMVKT